MSDFAELTVGDGWARRPGPQTVQETQTREMIFLNADRSHEDAPELTTIVAGRESLAPQSGSNAAKEITTDYLSQAMLWPKYAVESGMATPFIAGGVAGLFLSPMFMPTGTLSGFVLGGYIAGMGTYYAAASRIKTEKSTTPIQTFIAQKTASEAATSAETLDQIPHLPAASDLSDEIDLHLRSL